MALVRILSLWKGEILARRRSDVTMGGLAKVVAGRYGLTAADLQRDDRSVTAIRYEAMAHMKDYGRFTESEIARYFKQHHTTVLHGLREYEKKTAPVRAPLVEAGEDGLHQQDDDQGRSERHDSPATETEGNDGQQANLHPRTFGHPVHSEGRVDL